MSHIALTLLSQDERKRLHEKSLDLLAHIGVSIPDEEVFSLLGDHGAQPKGERLLLSPELVEESLEKAGKSFTLYGREGKEGIHFATGNTIFCSSPGQFARFENGRRREARSQDFLQAIHVAHHLPHIDLVGGLAMPLDIPPSQREAYMAKELFSRTTKPIFLWFSERRSFQAVFEMSVLLASGEKEAREKPRLFAFLEPISPLRFPKKGLEILKEATSLGLPVMIGPMAQSGMSAPIALAGTLAQENAEILAGIVVTQLLRPGTPICYGGIPHVTDPRTGSISFGSPEQALLGVVMAEMGTSFYGFPSYINVGLTDSLSFDTQNGWEKGITLILGMLAGATTFGHMGIVGCDQGGSLEQLLLDHELISFCKRIVRGINFHLETASETSICEGIAQGTFFGLEETARLFREELWLPQVSFRGPFREGNQGIVSQVKEEKECLLSLPLPLLEEKESSQLEEYFQEMERESTSGEEG